MTELTVHGENVDNIFDLLGYKENDLTFSLGWALSKNRPLLKAFMSRIIKKNIPCKNTTISLQEYGKDGGFTDIELSTDEKLFCIIEAKMGWNLPAKSQLKRYINRSKFYKFPFNRLVIISECKKEYAKAELGKLKLKLPVIFISWQDIYSLIDSVYCRCNHAEKRLLKELDKYFRKVITMQNPESNMVFCVSLSSRELKWSKLLI